MSTPIAQPVRILQLYPNDMNIYGDNGNLQVLKKRLEWRGYDVEVVSYNVGDSLPMQVDIVLGGGGQDSGQAVIHADLLKIKDSIIGWAEDGVPMLAVCGLYQLFGHFFQTSEGARMEGVGIFEAETYATPERLIGNVVARNSQFGDIIGYENHSGQTYLKKGASAFARVIKGAGNNVKDGQEGARFKSTIGTYLHGSLLPKNPAIADFLIETAVTRKYGSFNEKLVDDQVAQQARRIARNRPR
ncbi:glutamine amidotransferase [Candidatus Saccharibacteria bacterium]|nr:glutamine amidotransferase [Candidatus Saccharibacteria bacterium]NCS82994.1 glutamine amidotransferase [Candidatus Saccharibacteria bacterium]